VRFQPTMREARFARLLREARERAQLTQREVAEATGLARTLISELEHARCPVRLVHVRPLAAGLAKDDAERRALLACADPRAEGRQWGRLPPDTGAERRQRAAATLLRWQAEARAQREREAAILDAYRAGVKWREIVERYGIPKTTLYELLAERGVAVRRRKRDPRRRGGSPGPPRTTEAPDGSGLEPHGQGQDGNHDRDYL